MGDRPAFVNLFVYSDSLGFRRPGQPDSLAFTYPFLLAADLHTRLGVPVNLLLRGGGGATVTELLATLTRDTGYMGQSPTAVNVAVIQCGVVDCAPQPITYKLAPVLKVLPVAGPAIRGFLSRHRPGIQARWSYRTLPPAAFSRDYRRLVRICHTAFLRPIGVGIPLPTLDIERRSPGFRRSVGEYNRLIRDEVGESFCDVEAAVVESNRSSLLLEDGHHLTEAGHQLYARLLMGLVLKNL